MSAHVHAVWNWWCNSCAEGGEEDCESQSEADAGAEEHDRLNEHGVHS